MEARTVGPVVVVAIVVGTLGYFTLKHGDAKPREDEAASSAAGPGKPVNKYEMSGKDQRLTGEQAPTMPGGHPSLGSGMPTVGVKVDDPPPATGDRSGVEGIAFSFTVPAGWVKQAPASEMRKAQWGLRAEEGGEAGELYISTAGGGVSSNVDRWAKQMGQAEAKTSETKIFNLTITRVDVSGTFSGMGGPMAPAGGAKKDWRLLGAVIEGPDGLTFVKATGPAAVMAREEKAFDAFLASFKAR